MKNLIILFLLIFSIELNSQVIYTDRTELTVISTAQVLEQQPEISMFVFNDTHVTLNYDGRYRIFSVIFKKEYNKVISYKTLNANGNVIYFHVSKTVIGMGCELCTEMVMFNRII